MKIYKYEAFTDKAGMGNPAGVVFECDDLTEDEMQKAWILLKLLHDMEDTGATEFLIDKLKDFKTNEEFFGSMKRK